MPSMGQRATGKKRRKIGRGVAASVARAARVVGMEPLEGRVMMSADVPTDGTNGFDHPLVQVKWQGVTAQAVQGQYVVETKGAADFAALAARLGLPVSNVKGLGGGGFYQFDSNAPATQVARWEGKYGRFISVLQPNAVVRPADTIPNDTLYPTDQWNLNNTGQPGFGVASDPFFGLFLTPQDGLPGADISAQKAWDITTGSPNVIVAVIDTGADMNHPDLQPNIFHNPKEIPGNGIDDDGNGYVDDVSGFDTFNLDNDPTDDEGHGTHVSGIIGAVGNNGQGVSGVNWNVKIMPVKALGTAGGSTASVIGAFQYVSRM